MAISFDHETNINGTGTAVTTAHTITGANPIILALFRNNTDTTDVVTSVTWNGVAMTLLHKTSFVGSATDFSYLYALNAPATGTNNLVINSSASINYVGAIVSYNGVVQTGQPEASAYTDNDTSQPSTYSVTTIANNAWTVLGVHSADVITAGTGSTSRGGIGSLFFDSNGGVTPAGSHSMTVSAGTRNHSGLIVSLAPVATPTNPAFLLHML